MLAGKTVLVTGSTGFIGCRLVEKLILEHNVKVRGLVRNFSRAARIARFPIDMPGAHLTDVEALERAIAGCEVVFHCAYDWDLPNENIDGIRNLAEACLRQGVRRMVHVSTMAVYEPLPNGDVTEESPTEPWGWNYKDNKLAIEREILNYVRERNLCATILQPTIVYGPFSKFWTVTPVEMLLTGTVVLPADGLGLCNPVYVDDVVNALILAAERDQAVGERFLISGPKPVMWRDFFGAIESHLGVKSLTFMSDEELKCLMAEREQSLRPSPVLKLLRPIYDRRLPQCAPVNHLPCVPGNAQRMYCAVRSIPSSKPNTGL